MGSVWCTHIKCNDCGSFYSHVCKCEMGGISSGAARARTREIVARLREVANAGAAHPASEHYRWAADLIEREFLSDKEEGE